LRMVDEHPPTSGRIGIPPLISIVLRRLAPQRQMEAARIISVALYLSQILYMQGRDTLHTSLELRQLR
jgi:hypothetical protein